MADTGVNWQVNAIRQDFPILSEHVHGKPLIYFDNAATTQRPQCVIDAMDDFHCHYNANVHRGAHFLADKATAAYEGTREKLRQFINATSSQEIIFTKGTTESINLVTHSFGRHFFKTGDEVILSEMEHHANIVPWQILRDQLGIVLKIIPMNDQGELVLDHYQSLFTERTRFVALNYISNALGTINPVKAMINMAHKHDVPVLLDAAQALAHEHIDVQTLDCDFLVSSAHKAYGPTGVGFLYGKQHWLEQMSPYQGGGDMIQTVTFEHTTYNALPYKFEAGTPNIAGAIGFGAALDYLANLDFAALTHYERTLTAQMLQTLRDIDGVRIIGEAKNRLPIFSFVVDKVHALDIATLIDHQGIAVRTGHHCAMPAMQHFGVNATIRASLTLYNTSEEITRFAAVLQSAITLIKEA